MMVDSFHSLGALPESEGCWNSLANTPPSWVEQSSSTLPLSLSGIAAFLGFTLCRTEVTNCLLMVRASGGWCAVVIKTDEEAVGLFCKRGGLWAADHCRFGCSAHHDI